MKHYSPTTGGFYDLEVHGRENIPGDAAEITEGEWQRLLQAQTEGKRIVAGTDGRPVAVTYEPTEEELARSLVRQRDRELVRTDGLVARHRDELEVNPGGVTTLTTAQYKALQKYRMELRKLPEAPRFPKMKLPKAPL